jgi:hypothetical protein
MAIYGDIVSEHQPSVQPNDLRQVNSVDTRPLIPALDPSNAADPTLLAKQLLLLIPDAPPLHLIIRLMLCLKPSNDDWDDPDFPYLFADLNDCIEEFGLERALHVTARPIPDDTPPGLIRKFSQCTAAAIGVKVFWPSGFLVHRQLIFCSLLLSPLWSRIYSVKLRPNVLILPVF